MLLQRASSCGFGIGLAAMYAPLVVSRWSIGVHLCSCFDVRDMGMVIMQCKYLPATYLSHM